MPYFRHRSFVFAPASASLSTPMICSSVNRRLFIRLLPDEQTLLHSGTNLGEQTTSTRPMSRMPRRPPVKRPLVSSDRVADRVGDSDAYRLASRSSAFA